MDDFCSNTSPAVGALALPRPSYTCVCACLPVKRCMYVYIHINVCTCRHVYTCMCGSLFFRLSCLFACLVACLSGCFFACVVSLFGLVVLFVCVFLDFIRRLLCNSPSGLAARIPCMPALGLMQAECIKCSDLARIILEVRRVPQQPHPPHKTVVLFETLGTVSRSLLALEAQVAVPLIESHPWTATPNPWQR